MGEPAKTTPPMPVYEPEIDEWLDSPAGRAFLTAERDAAAAELGRMFGPQFLQVGRWGPADVFLPLPGTARRAVSDPRPAPGVGFLARAEALPVSGRSVDGVLLPHTLERCRDPHEVLREADRAITPGGRLMVLGFNPVGMVGLRRLLTRGGFPPGLNQLVSERRLRDWLALLGFDVLVSGRYYSSLSPGGLVKGRLRRLPVSWGAYMVVAVKRMRVITPLRKLWRAPAKVPGRLAEPTTRNST